MGGAGDLPDAQILAVWPARCVIAGEARAEQVGFGNESQHGRPQILTEADMIGIARRRPAHRRAFERGGAAKTRMDQEPVIDFGQRIDRVDIGGEEGGRLRFADRQHPARRQRTQRTRCFFADRGFQRRTHLREHVETESVARMRQAGIALRIGLLERHARLAHCGSAAFDANLLRRNRDIGIAPPQHLAMRHHPVRRRVLPGGDIEPFDQQRAIELRWIARPDHDEAGGVGRGGGGFRGPVPVRRRSARHAIGSGSAREEIFLGPIAKRGEIEGAEHQRRLAGHGNRSGGFGAGEHGQRRCCQ